MMTSQNSKSAELKKKSTYLENKTLFFLQIFKFKLNTKGYFMTKNSFLAEVTFKGFFSKCDRICHIRHIRIWSLLLNRSLMESFIFCAVIPKLTCFALTFTACLKTDFFINTTGF